MPTPSERRALLFVAAVAALGLGVRGLRSLQPNASPGSEREELATQIAAVDSAVTRGGRTRSKTAPRVVSPAVSRAVSSSRREVAEAPQSVDVDRATEAELDALPGIGPALASRIVEDRSSRGPFGSLDALQEVRGIGPALVARLAPFVSFSAPPRTPPAAGSRSRSSHP